MARIFISYRRQDRAGHAGRVYDHLRSFFGSGRVFMDVEGIEPGTDFEKILDDRISQAEVVVALIGPEWITALSTDGQRRIDTEGDYVRRELASAFRQRIEVIPVLVSGAAMPQTNELPEELGLLALRQAHVLGDPSFDAGMARLIQSVERSAARTREFRRLLAKPKHDFVTRKFARLLLLYEPTHPAMWIVHALFFAVLVMTVYTPAITWHADSIKSASIVFAELFLLAVLLRGIALLLEPDAAMSYWRRWLLLYNPPRVTMFALHALFLLMAFLWMVALPIVISRILQQPNDLARVTFLQEWIIFGVLTFAVREVAASKDPLKAALVDPNWFARLFCIWKPQRGIAWFPRLLYYSAATALFLVLPLALIDDENNLRGPDFAGSRGPLMLSILCGVICLAARNCSHAVEVGWHGADDQTLTWRLRFMLLLYVPWRRIGWLPAVLFWLILAMLAGLIMVAGPTINLLSLDPESRLAIIALFVVLLLPAWGWAQLYRPPAKWSDSAGASAHSAGAS